MRSVYVIAAIGAVIALACVAWLLWGIVGSFVTEVFEAFLNM